MTERELRNSYVDVMKGWVGITEGSTGHKEILNEYNSIRPLPRGYTASVSDDWCAITVSAAAKKANLLSIIPVECSCSALVNLHKSRGTWIENDAYTPNTGDQIFYDWQDDGKGDNTGAPDHVGVVEFVQNGVITVIEGNMGGSPDRVGRRTLVVNGRFIRGFGCPNFKSLEKVDETKGQKLMKEIAGDKVITDTEYWSDVIDGKKTPSAATVRSLLGKYHLSCLTDGELVAEACADGALSSLAYWKDVLAGSVKPSADNIASLISKYHEVLQNKK